MGPLFCSHDPGGLVRTATDCTHRAEECRRLAGLAIKPEDFGHFLEMAETWELLAKQRKAVGQAADAVSDEQASDEQLADEQVRDEQVADEQVADEQVADAGAAAQQVPDEQVADEGVVAQQVADEQVANRVADEQLADILVLADAIANRRAPLHLF